MAIIFIAAVALARSVSGQITITLVGDIMLSCGVEEYLKEYGYDYPYEDVREIFLQDDFTIGNLECPLTNGEGSAQKSIRFLFKGDVENAAALKRAGFDCLNLANNHSMDSLSDGLLDTMLLLEENGLLYTGASANFTLPTSCVYEKKGIRVGILVYSALPPEGFFFNGEKPTIQYISSLDLSGLEKDIASLDCDFTILYFHWGEEYLPYKSDTQEMIAKKAIDAGADFVVGTHPHVLQESEVYQGKQIYYSLGNFIFDRQIPPGTDESMILQITINRKGLLDIEEIPVKIHQAKPLIRERSAPDVF